MADLGKGTPPKQPAGKGSGPKLPSGSGSSPGPNPVPTK